MQAERLAYCTASHCDHAGSAAAKRQSINPGPREIARQLKSTLSSPKIKCGTAGCRSASERPLLFFYSPVRFQVELGGGKRLERDRQPEEREPFVLFECGKVDR